MPCHFRTARFTALSTAVAALAVAAAGTLAAGAAQPAAPRLHRAPAISNVVDGVIFEPGNWTPD